GDGFVLLFSGAAPGCDAASLAVGEVVPRLLAIAPGHGSAHGPAHEPRHQPGLPADRLIDRDGLFAARYDAQPGTTYLIRPDQHVLARWRSFRPECIRRALERALALPAA